MSHPTISCQAAPRAVNDVSQYFTPGEHGAASHQPPLLLLLVPMHLAMENPWPRAALGTSRAESVQDSTRHWCFLQ